EVVAELRLLHHPTAPARRQSVTRAWPGWLGVHRLGRHVQLAGSVDPEDRVERFDDQLGGYDGPHGRGPPQGDAPVGIALLPARGLEHSRTAGRRGWMPYGRHQDVLGLDLELDSTFGRRHFAPHSGSSIHEDPADDARDLDGQLLLARGRE